MFFMLGGSDLAIIDVIQVVPVPGYPCSYPCIRVSVPVLCCRVMLLGSLGVDISLRL
jgi:hypothetical protein